MLVHPQVALEGEEVIWQKRGSSSKQPQGKDPARHAQGRLTRRGVLAVVRARCGSVRRVLWWVMLGSEEEEDSLSLDDE